VAKVDGPAGEPAAEEPNVAPEPRPRRLTTEWSGAEDKTIALEPIPQVAAVAEPRPAADEIAAKPVVAKPGKVPEAVKSKPRPAGGEDAKPVRELPTVAAAEPERVEAGEDKGQAKAEDEEKNEEPKMKRFSFLFLVV
jgi:Predicted membrane protein